MLASSLQRLIRFEKSSLKALLIRALTTDVKYIQGQYDDESKKFREYFYYIDHHGQLFLDDTKIKNFTSCFKEQKFLEFFFKNIRLNSTQRFTDNFPFVSFCGRERNYIRCDDVPFVFTELDYKENRLYLNNTKKFSCTFNPELLHVNLTNGRFYYPLIEVLESWPTSIALLKSQISLHLFKSIKEIDENKFEFNYKSQIYKLDNSSEFNKNMAECIKKYSACKEEI